MAPTSGPAVGPATTIAVDRWCLLGPNPFIFSLKAACSILSASFNLTTSLSGRSFSAVSTLDR